VEVAVSGALLLVFASNTALIGTYHVLLALSRLGFLPGLVAQRNRWRQTPHWAILIAVGIPVLILLFSQGNVSLLGDLYLARYRALARAVCNPDHPSIFLARGRLARPPATVLAVLPPRAAAVDGLVTSVQRVAERDPIVFLFKESGSPSVRMPQLLEVVSAYLDDPVAQAAFARADRLARQHGRVHRYLYLTGAAGAPEVATFWRQMRPRETLAVAGDTALLADLPPLSMQYNEDDDASIIHYVVTATD
jgi:hypothetical protein